jgi:hypothetical protein
MDRCARWRTLSVEAATAVDVLLATRNAWVAKSNTDVRGAPNVTRAPVTGGHWRLLIPGRSGGATGMGSHFPS